MKQTTLTIPNQQTLFNNDLSVPNTPATVTVLDFSALETTGVTYIQVNVDGQKKVIVHL